MHITVTYGDALRIDADVLVLKYAQDTYGVDELVVDRLVSAGQLVKARLPKPGACRQFDTGGTLGARTVLFVGVVPLYSFGYDSVRDLAKRALEALSELAPDAGHVVFTLHGAGIGLDESEAFRAEIAGILEAIDSGASPTGLRRVTIVERNAGRARRLQALLKRLSPAGQTRSAGRRARPRSRGEALRTAGVNSAEKPHLFVAMPFAAEFDDHFHYGIQQAAHAAGYLCERADLASFTGDVLAWVKARIDSARLLVADLSTANPNVYLEVGYAWGKGIPTVLVARAASELKFDVKGQRCLLYTSIRSLEESLTRELVQLRQSS